MFRKLIYFLNFNFVLKKFSDNCSPEILRCPLDALILKAKELDIGPPASILGRAMDPPDLSNIQTNILNLKEVIFFSVFYSIINYKY